jgi:hypothetical protein
LQEHEEVSTVGVARASVHRARERLREPGRTDPFLGASRAPSAHRDIEGTWSIYCFTVSTGAQEEAFVALATDLLLA